MAENHVTEEEILEGINELNESGMFGVIETDGLGVKELRDIFMATCETVPEVKESEEEFLEKAPNSVRIYNALVIEIEALQKAALQKTVQGKRKEKQMKKENGNGEGVKEEKVKKAKKVKEEKVKVEKAETRPNMLKRKILEGLDTIEALYADEELVAKYENHKAWIKNDFAKIQNKAV